MLPVSVDPSLLKQAARLLHGYANVLDSSTPPQAYEYVEPQIKEAKEAARQLELAAERNQGARR